MSIPRQTLKRNRIFRIFVILRCLIVIGTLGLALPVQGIPHPMGNFSINQFSDLEIGKEAIRLQYVVDMAEIPTFQEMQQHQLVAAPNGVGTDHYLRQKTKELTAGLALTVNEQRVPLRIQSTKVTFPPGAGELTTLRLQILYEASIPFHYGKLIYEDHNYRNRIGWKEIIAHPTDDITLKDSSVPQVSQSQNLTAYQQDLLQTPPQDHQATVTFALNSPQQVSTEVASSIPSIAEPLRSSETRITSSQNALTNLMGSSDITFSMGIISMAIALGLGAFHALEPGHGKTLVAAYLIGSRGTPLHAILLGVTVTASHTIGVFALGGVTLFASQYFFPEQVYPWLGFTSGLLILGTGILLLQRITGTFRHQHSEHHHAHNENHHHPHSHGHHHGIGEDTSLRSLLTLGITGGMIPCPAALVVLLSAVALNRIGFGMLLIVAFSAGLALVLTTIGLLLVVAKGRLQKWHTEGPWLRYLPYVSPAVIMPLGLFIAVRSFIDTGLIPTFLT